MTTGTIKKLLNLKIMSNTNAMEHEHRDDIGTKMGMWLFLFTEVLLFGGLFVVYAVYRFNNPEDFHHGSSHLDILMGTINTAVLLTSSLTVALSITALQKGNKKLSLRLIGITIVFALIFLVIKYFEWSSKFDHGLFPAQEHFKSLSRGESQFFHLYYFMTGLHAIHVIVGAIILIFVAYYIRKDKITQDKHVYLENGGLYWHLVDVIWIFLFPLFYLII